MSGNIINAAFCGTSYITTRPAWLIDYGMVLKLSGIELPEVYEVDFANTKTETATRVLGGPDGVTIPDQYFLAPNAQQIFAWLYLHASEDDGYTRIQVTIPINKRPDVTDDPPTPEEHSIIEQAIAALNIGVERAETAADDAEQSADDAAESATNAAESARLAKLSENNGKESEDNAAQSAESASRSALNAADSEIQAKGYANDAAESKKDAEDAADRAEQMASTAGYMFFYIDERGHLIYQRTSNTQVDFYLENGHLYVEAIA